MKEALGESEATEASGQSRGRGSGVPQEGRLCLWALGTQVFSANNGRYHLAAAGLEGTPPRCRPTPAPGVRGSSSRRDILPPFLPRPPSWELMNLRTWAGLGLAQLALTLAQGLGFLNKSMGLAGLQGDN